MRDEIGPRGWAVAALLYGLTMTVPPVVIAIQYLLGKPEDVSINWLAAVIFMAAGTFLLRLAWKLWRRGWHW